LSEIKIVDFGISTKVKNCETLRNRTILGTAYYMAPEVISEKPYAYEADIWSLGCIVYELVTGIKPYSNLNAVSAMSCMIQYSSPLEQAEEQIQDFFYDKPNRSLLLFLQKCWRPNNNFRPSASDLLDHAFLSE
jgi:serine/threonine protein kinase